LYQLGKKVHKEKDSLVAQPSGLASTKPASVPVIVIAALPVALLVALAPVTAAAVTLGPITCSVQRGGLEGSEGLSCHRDRLRTPYQRGFGPNLYMYIYLPYAHSQRAYSLIPLY
jgi:hypothetical protein